MSSLFSSFTSAPTINISFNGVENKKKKSFRLQNKEESIEVPLYGGNEAVSGKIDVIVQPGKKYEHLGVKIEMIGHIGKFLFGVTFQQSFNRY